MNGNGSPAALQQGEAKREKQLVARAFAESFGAHALAAIAERDQHWPIIVVVVGGQGEEGAAGREAKQRAGARDERVLRGGAMAFDRA